MTQEDTGIDLSRVRGNSMKKTARQLIFTKFDDESKRMISFPDLTCIERKPDLDVQTYK